MRAVLPFIVILPIAACSRSQAAPTPEPVLFDPIASVVTHQLPSGRISPANGPKDCSSTAGGPWGGRSRGPHTALPDVPSGNEYRRRLRAGRRHLAPRTLVHALGGPEQAADLRADEGPGPERRSAYRRGNHRAHAGGSARPLGLDPRRRAHHSAALAREVRRRAGSVGRRRHAMPGGLSNLVGTVQAG